MPLNNNFISVDGLKGVSETLLLTLYMRSLETKRKDSIIQDHKAVEIVERINYNFARHDSELSQAIISIRTSVIDHLAQTFIDQYPNTLVVNLGAGLCTRFFRLDNGSVRWLNIDLPRVEPVWNNLIGALPRSQYFACSILDFSWMDQVKAIAAEKILFIAEGVLMFLTESEVKQLMNQVQANFAQSRMIFDSLGIFLAEKSNLNSGDLGIDASYKWGIKNLQELQSWNQQIELLDQCYYFDRYKSRLGWLGVLSYLPMLRRQVQIGHIRFG